MLSNIKPECLKIRKIEWQFILVGWGIFWHRPKALNEKKEFNFARIPSLYKLKSFHTKIFGKEMEEKMWIQS